MLLAVCLFEVWSLFKAHICSSSAKFTVICPWKSDICIYSTYKLVYISTRVVVFWRYYNWAVAAPLLVSQTVFNRPITDVSSCSLPVLYIVRWTKMLLCRMHCNILSTSCSTSTRPIQFRPIFVTVVVKPLSSMLKSHKNLLPWCWESQ